MHSGSPVVLSLPVLDADTAPVLVPAVVLELVLEPVLVSGPVVVVPLSVAEPAVVVTLSVVVGASVVLTPVELPELVLAAVPLSVLVLPSSEHAASAGATSEIP
jgi:hypothetical protein